jgi:hypothetical protein
MVGRRSLQCAVTSTIARGAEVVPRPRIEGTLVVMDLISAACPGSFITGIGPPPWQTAMTGARLMAGKEDELWLRAKMGSWNNLAAERSAAADVRLLNCMRRLRYC